MSWISQVARPLQVLAVFAVLFMPVAVAEAQTTELGLDRSTPSSFDHLAELEERVVDVVDDVRSAVVGLQLGGAGGSGTLISEDGYIATAAHVIQRRDRSVRVFLSDGSSYQGRTLGMNHDADYGLVHADIGEAAIQYVDLGDTFDAVEGQWVIAMGHPLGTETEESGFAQFRPPVVRIGRIHTIRQEPRAWHIVVDAPLISGDSGGPMFDLNGNLIAINVSIDVSNPRVNNGTWITPFVENLDRMKDNELIEGVGVDGDGGGISPQEFQELNGLGIEHLDAEQWEQAEQVFKRMLEHDPTSFVAYYNLACTYSLWSETVDEPQSAQLRRQAFDALRDSIDNGWNDEEHMTNDSDLDPIRDDFAYDALMRRMNGQEPYVGLTPRETDRGVEIASIGRGTAAEEYDLRVGDLIREFGNRTIETRQVLIDAARETRPGDRVPVRVLRDGRDLGLTLIMGGRRGDGETLPDRPFKNAQRIRQLVRSAGEHAARSVVEVRRANGRLLGYGAVVKEDGLILVKNSEIREHRGRLSVRLPSGRDLGASRVAYSPLTDLALLRISTTDLVNPLRPVRFAEEDSGRIGNLVYSVGTDAVPFAMGVRSLNHYQTQSRAFLGVQVESAERFDLEALGLRGGVIVTQVTPDSSAAREGVQEGDLIHRVDDQPIHSLNDLGEAIQANSPGDTIDVHIFRHGEPRTKRVTLGQASAPSAPSSPMFNRVRGPANDVDRGFGEVIQHDCLVSPNQTGSLLIDMEGNVIGFNIARSDRTKTYALPSTTVLEALPGLLRQAKRNEQERSEDF